MSYAKTFNVVFKNMIIMLRNRGYMVDDYKNITFEDTSKMYIEQQSYFEFSHNNEKEKKMIVLFLIYNKISQSYIKETIQEFNLDNFSKDSDYKLMLILPDNPTNKIIQSHNYTQIFHFEELYIDKLSHHFVPKHELISDINKQNTILENYSLDQKSKYSLPIIRKSDPITKYFNANKGDIFKISRQSNSAGTYVIYRVVS